MRTSTTLTKISLKTYDRLIKNTVINTIIQSCNSNNHKIIKQ